MNIPAEGRLCNSLEGCKRPHAGGCHARGDGQEPNSNNNNSKSQSNNTKVRKLSLIFLVLVMIMIEVRRALDTRAVCREQKPPDWVPRQKLLEAFLGGPA